MIDDNNNIVEVDRNDLISSLRDLNTIVVSLARIGSFAAGAEDVSLEDKLTVDFLRDWDVFRRLASVREKLSAPFSDELGEDGMDELEREMKEIPIWSVSQRQP